MIYLDNNATTFLSPEVQETISSYLSVQYGNPSSIHHFGQQAKGVLNSSLHTCSRLFGCHPIEIVFTSGATEALNMLIRGIPKKRHIITSSLEHPAVLEPLKYSDCTVSYLDPLPGMGAILPDQVKEAIRPETSLILLTAANNETGIKTDISSIASIAEAHCILFVVDGVALLGKDILELPKGISAICFSGHKIHAPSGIGVCVVKKGTKFHPFILGGPQQRGMRGGTENLLGILALTKALEHLEKNLPEDVLRMGALRDKLEQGLSENLHDILIHGKNQNRVSNTSNIAFLGVDGESLLMRLDLAKIAASHGSACSAGALEPSRVLLNMGISSKIARSSIRFSLSRYTTDKEIEKTIETVTTLVKLLRN